MKNTTSSFIYLKYFLLFVGVFIIAALLMRFIFLFNGSTFSDYHYTVLVFAKKSYVVRINTETPSMSVLEIQKDRNKLSSKNIAKDSILLALPIQGVIEFNNNQEFNNFTNDFFSFSSSVSTAFDEINHSFTELNSLDVLKMYFAVKNMKDSERQSMSIQDLASIPDKSGQISQLFRDPVIFNEKNSIEIINNTSVDGLGTRVRHMLENNGFNIISVTSGDDTPISKIIVRVEENNTTRFLTRFFSFTVEKKPGTAVADITIILGKTYSNQINE